MMRMRLAFSLAQAGQSLAMTFQPASEACFATMRFKASRSGRLLKERLSSMAFKARHMPACRRQVAPVIARGMGVAQSIHCSRARNNWSAFAVLLHLRPPMRATARLSKCRLEEKMASVTSWCDAKRCQPANHLNKCVCVWTCLLGGVCTRVLRACCAHKPAASVCLGSVCGLWQFWCSGCCLSMFYAPFVRFLSVHVLSVCVLWVCIPCVCLWVCVSSCLRRCARSLVSSCVWHACACAGEHAPTKACGQPWSIVRRTEVAAHMLNQSIVDAKTVQRCSHFTHAVTIATRPNNNDSLTCTSVARPPQSNKKQ
eukprot:14902129-Alexandrium_andersonii.AAC.1